MTTSASQPTRRPRAVLYSRLSQASLASTSLLGQGDDLRALAAREGWDIVREFVDEGLSGGRRRAAADESLRMLRDGEADILAAFAVDRYSRQGIGEDAEVIRVVREGAKTARRARVMPPRVVFIREGIDSQADPMGWASRYANWSEMAYTERELMVARRKGSVRRMQSAGRFTGRGAEPWGYRSTPAPDGRGRILVPDPEEAAVIREVADRLIAGESASAVARDLVRRRIPTPRSEARLAILAADRGGASRPDLDGVDHGIWSSSRLAQTMGNEYLLGRVVQYTSRSEDVPDELANSDGTNKAGRRGRAVLGDDGRPLVAFEPILEISTFNALQERFARGAGRGVQRVRKAARLGSGLVFCGYCGSKCYVRSSHGDRYVSYRCSGRSQGVECVGVSVDARIVEEAIETDYLAAFGRLPAVELVEVRGEPEVAEELAAITDRLRALSEQIVAPRADVVALSADIASLQASREELAARPAESRIITRDLGKTWGELWSDGDVHERRRHLLRAYDHFLIHRPSAPDRVLPVVKPSPEDVLRT